MDLKVRRFYRVPHLWQNLCIRRPVISQEGASDLDLRLVFFQEKQKEENVLIL